MGIDWEKRRQNLHAFNISMCYQCGKCSSACTIHAFKREYDPRSFIMDLLLGHDLENRLLWLCSHCDRCVECPQNVSPRELFVAIRNQLFDGGKAPEEVKSMMKSILETGWIASIRGPNMIRERMGLPSIREVPLKEVLK